jgi:preprotein translocase subunit SecB
MRWLFESIFMKKTEEMEVLDSKEVNPTSESNFGIEKIYVKDISLEMPNAPEIFQYIEPPEIEIAMNNSGEKVSDNFYEVVLKITVTARIKEKTLLLVEVSQAGIFELLNIPEENFERIFSVICPNILFPYAREVITDMSVKAGLPQIILSAVNFEAIYAKNKKA